MRRGSLPASTGRRLAFLGAEDVDAAVVDRVQIRISGSGRAHACAGAIQLDLVARRIFLKGCFVLGVREEVFEAALRPLELRVALDLFALHEHYRVETFEWGSGLEDCALAVAVAKASTAIRNKSLNMRGP